MHRRRSFAAVGAIRRLFPVSNYTLINRENYTGIYTIHHLSIASLYSLHKQIPKFKCL